MPMPAVAVVTGGRFRAAVVSSLAALLLVGGLFPAGVASAAPGDATSRATRDDASAARRWTSRPIGQAHVRRRDRGLVADLPNTAMIGYHPETGRVRSLDGTSRHPLGRPVPAVAAGKRQLTAADARSRARRFVDHYGRLFGLGHGTRELTVTAIRPRTRDSAGTTTAASGSSTAAGAVVRFAQSRAGVPVLGGELAVQVDPDGAVVSVAGEVLPAGAQPLLRATVSANEAIKAARTWTAREDGRSAAAVVASSEGPGIYDPRLMDDPELASLGPRLVWRVDVRTATGIDGPGQERLIIVDARGGVVLTAIGRSESAEGPSRRICDDANVPGRSWGCSGPFARVEGQAPAGIADVDAAYRLMGVTYDYFLSRFGRDGIDGQGSRMKATVRYCPKIGCPWRNAEWRWGLQQATFGRGWAQADDIVGHEYTHGVLDAEAPLFYHYQSGAINESYADVFGELIDLSWKGGTDTPWSAWKMGEDAPGGPFRDLRDPTRYGQPDHVRSRLWRTSTADDGGVHRNNGVGNKAAYLVAAGGSFRGYRVKALGPDRMARIWYQALTTRLTSAANYIDLADALISACRDLVETSAFVSADCASVRRAVRATQMDVRPRRLAPAAAPVCGPGTRPADVLRDDLEQPSSGAWAVTTAIGPGQGWFWPQNPNDTPGWDGTWASSGKLNFYAPDRDRRSDATIRLVEPVVLPAHAYLRFGHGYSFDRDGRRRYDGGGVEIKVDGGRWRGVAGLFTHGGYNGRIARGSGNPLAGHRAWTGESHGWARARIDLSRFAGSRVKIRFRAASDRRVGGRGWYVDDVRIYTCADDRDAPKGTVSIDGGAASTTTSSVTLSLTWSDATTWVASVRLSNSAALDGQGRLADAKTVPVQADLPWDLADPAYGGTGDPGTKRVFAQLRDAVGNWSSVFSDDIELAPATAGTSSQRGSRGSDGTVSDSS